jgi:hypothetical protein
MCLLEDVSSRAPAGAFRDPSSCKRGLPGRVDAQPEFRGAEGQRVPKAGG